MSYVMVAILGLIPQFLRFHLGNVTNRVTGNFPFQIGVWQPSTWISIQFKCKYMQLCKGAIWCEYQMFIRWRPSYFEPKWWLIMLIDDMDNILLDGTCIYFHQTLINESMNGLLYLFEIPTGLTRSKQCGKHTP